MLMLRVMVWAIDDLEFWASGPEPKIGSEVSKSQLQGSEVWSHLASLLALT